MKYQTFELPNDVFDRRIRLKELGLKIRAEKGQYSRRKFVRKKRPGGADGSSGGGNQKSRIAEPENPTQVFEPEREKFGRQSDAEFIRDLVEPKILPRVRKMAIANRTKTATSKFLTPPD